MKRILQISVFGMLIFLGSAYPNDASAQYDNYDDSYYDESYRDDRGEVSYQTFYDELSPHGNWVEYPGHGYVWQPSLRNDFRPYSTGGHWVWSDRYEWVWVSDYDWGWAPFHYGRWFHDNRYGWLWVPGYEWSGAWVSWRDGGDYYGWAPLRPGFNININFGGYNAPNDWWTFTPRRHILNRNWNNHCLDYRNNVTVIHQTTIINNYYYGDRYGFRTGPRREYFERYTGRITPVQFRQSTRPGRTTFRDNEVNIYRPPIRQESVTDNTAPRRFQRSDGSVVNNNDGIGDNHNPPRTRDFREGEFRTRERENVRPRTNDLPRERSGSFERNDARPRPIEDQPGREPRFDRRENNPARDREMEPRRQEPVRPNNDRSNEPKFERRREQPAQRMETAPSQPQTQPRQIERRPVSDDRQPVQQRSTVPENGRTRRF
jgi:hypothetical protein